MIKVCSDLANQIKTIKHRLFRNWFFNLIFSSITKVLFLLEDTKFGHFLTRDRFLKTDFTSGFANWSETVKKLKKG